jgi:hypothetical protein
MGPFAGQFATSGLGLGGVAAGASSLHTPSIAALEIVVKFMSDQGFVYQGPVGLEHALLVGVQCAAAVVRHKSGSDTTLIFSIPASDAPPAFVVVAPVLGLAGMVASVVVESVP